MRAQPSLAQGTAPRSHPLPSPTDLTAKDRRPRLSPNERAHNSSSYFAVLPTPSLEGGPGGAGFDFTLPPTKASPTIHRGAEAAAGEGQGQGQGGFFFGGGGTTTPSSRPHPVFASTPAPDSRTFSLTPQPSFGSTTPLGHPATTLNAPPSAYNPFLPLASAAQPPPPSASASPFLPSSNTSTFSPSFAPPPSIRTPAVGGARNSPAVIGRLVTNPRFTAFTPAAFLGHLATPPPSPSEPTVVVLDLRTHSSWLQCRPQSSVNICVPSTLLRRPNHGVEQLAAALSGRDRELFQSWSTTAQTIVVLDNDSTALVEAGGIASLLAKFVKANYNGTLGWVRGGFAAVRSQALGGSAELRELLQFGAVEGEGLGVVDPSGTTLASPGKHARPVLQVRDLPIAAFQFSSTSAFSHSGMQSASMNMGGRSSAGSKASSSGRPGLGKRRKSGTEGFSLSLGGMSDGSMTPGVREAIAERRATTNPFFDNIRQNSEALSLERCLANLSPIELPSIPPEVLNRLPSFLSSLLSLPPLERAHLLARQFYDLEVAERDRLEGTLHWHANVQGTDLEHASSNHEFKKYGISAGVELGSLNRFKNIFPYDHARVRLKQFNHGATDYVNASHVQLETSSRRFIASQGPLHSTFPDFWQMCDQEDVGVIVMLTNLQEGGREKCSRYWIPQPSCGWEIDVEGDTHDDNASHGFFSATKAAPEKEADTVRRTISIHRTTDPPTKRRKIRHFQYRAWPDFDIPAEAADVVRLVREVDQAQREYMAEVNWQGEAEPPILAHCSAGVGRTGVFIMVSSMLDKLARDRQKAREAAANSMDVDDHPPHASPPLPSPDSGSSSDTASLSAGMSASSLGPSTASLSPASSLASSSAIDLTADVKVVPPLEREQPIFAGVNEMREQRMSMVANYRQFCCVHECILVGTVEDLAAEASNL